MPKNHDLPQRQFNSEARQIRGLILSKLESFYDDLIGCIVKQLGEEIIVFIISLFAIHQDKSLS